MKLLLSDYDGTLKTDVKNLRLNVEAIWNFRQAGNHFGIATGRGFDSIKKEILEHHIPYDYLITNDGAMIFDCRDRVLHAFDSSHDTLEGLHSGLKSRGYNPTIYKVPGTEKIVELEVITKYFESFVDMSSFMNMHPEILQTIVKERFNKYIFFKVKVNKAEAIQKLLELLSVTYDSVTTVGDNVNDTEMLLHFNGYKMKNNKGLGHYSMETVDQVHTLIKKIR